MPKKNTEQYQKELIQKYGCTGCCYGGLEYDGGVLIEHPICPCIDTCDETRHVEFIATIVATLTIIFGVLLIFISLFLMFIHFV